MTAPTTTARDLYRSDVRWKDGAYLAEMRAHHRAQMDEWGVERLLRAHPDARTEAHAWRLHARDPRKSSTLFLRVSALAWALEWRRLYYGGGR